MVVLAAVAWGGGRIFGAGKVQSVSAGVFVVAALAAVIVGTSSGAIGWFAERNLGF